MKITGFTSLLETSFGRNPVSASSLLHGIRIKHEDNWYLVGDACKNLGRNPHRIVNASPDELDYKILFNSALLLSANNYSEKINLTVGFPFSTYNMYRPLAEKYLMNKNFMVEYDTSVFKRDGIVERKVVEVAQFDIIPELAGCVIGLKKEYNATEENFLMISIGFGTIEMGVVTAEGLNRRTVISVPGIIRCIKHLRDELERDNFIGFMTDHQLDEAFKKGSVILNRQNINLTTLRSNILKSFYKEYISDTIRSMISDRDFETLQKIYVCGGGVHYQEIRDCFKNEFEKIMPVEIVAEPDTLAAIGYYHNSQKMPAVGASNVVGIDLGNSSTYVCAKETE
ncbi:MAG: hypothetical protein RLZZ42_207 [Bacteroidota bacterium]